MEDLIFNQTQIPKDELRYGLRSSAATGCGWIAVYNALWLMGYEAQPRKLIRYFEKSLPVINGNLGTFVLTPAEYFRRRGFGVKILVRRSQFDQAVEDSDVCLLFYHWHKKWKLGAHYVALQKQDGKILGYNTYKNSSGPDNYGLSLERFLKRRKYYMAVLIAITDKEKDRG